MRRQPEISTVRVCFVFRWFGVLVGLSLSLARSFVRSFILWKSVFSPRVVAYNSWWTWILLSPSGVLRLFGGPCHTCNLQSRRQHPRQFPSKPDNGSSQPCHTSCVVDTTTTTTTTTTTSSNLFSHSMQASDPTGIGCDTASLGKVRKEIISVCYPQHQQTNVL